MSVETATTSVDAQPLGAVGGDAFSRVRLVEDVGSFAADARLETDPRGRPIPTARGLGALIETTKPGITRFVTMTSLVGLAMTALAREWPSKGDLILIVLGTTIGTALSSSGANTLNQVMERRRDALMHRTRTRPLPSGRSETRTTAWFGAACGVLGLAVLWVACGFWPMVISALCIISYLAWYTPLKPSTSLATYVGGIPGALPPLIGSTAGSLRPGAESLLEPAGWTLFVLMFAWQIPHFLAIAWMYKDDYARGGYAVLPVVDRSGKWTAMTVAFWTASLLPAALLPALAMPGLLGWPYLLLASVSTLGYGWLSVSLVREPTRERAKRVFFGSIIHLPVLLLAMTIEAGVRRVVGAA